MVKKRKKRGDKPFAAVEIDVFFSDQWTLLNKTEAWVYVILKSFYRGDNQVFTAPFDAIKKRSRIAQGGTINKAIKGLERREWIKVTRYAKQGKARGLRVKPNRYQLTWKHDKRRW